MVLTQLICLFFAYQQQVEEILMMAATTAKSSEMKSGIPFTSLFTSFATPSSPQGTSNNVPSPPSVCFPTADKSSICRMQGNNFFITRTIQSYVAPVLKKSMSVSVSETNTETCKFLKFIHFFKVIIVFTYQRRYRVSDGIITLKCFVFRISISTQTVTSKFS